MTGGDNSKPAGDVGQAIRRLPTGLYELSPTLPRPQPTSPPRQWRWRDLALFAVAGRWKNVGLLPVASAMVGVASLVMFSIERQGDDSVTQPAAATQVAHATPLIVDVASAPTRPEAPQARPDPLPATTATAAPPVQVPLRSPSPDDTTSRTNERGAQGSVANVGALGSDERPVSEWRSAPSGRARAEKRRLDAHHASRRGTIKSAQRKIHYRSFWDTLFPPLSFR
jgi:hypothetical protein